MRSLLLDELFDHSKIIRAGVQIGGYHGVAAALGFYSASILYANRHLTDGVLPREVVLLWPHSKQPSTIIKALVAVGLWEPCDGGWRIHDFHDHNDKAVTVKEKRAADRERKRKKRTAVRP